MKLLEIIQLLNAEVICGDDCLQVNIVSAYGADLMNDIIDFSKEGALLLTGMNNVQLIQAANDVGVSVIVFLRGKNPPEEVVELAIKLGIPLLITRKTMFESCGILYSNEVKACPLRMIAIGTL